MKVSEREELQQGLQKYLSWLVGTLQVEHKSVQMIGGDDPRPDLPASVTFGLESAQEAVRRTRQAYRSALRQLLKIFPELREHELVKNLPRELMPTDLDSRF